MSDFLHHLTEKTTAEHRNPPGVLRAGLWDPRCRATSPKGSPCRGHIFCGQEWAYDDTTGRPVLDDEAWAKFQRGLCRMHRDES